MGRARFWLGDVAAGDKACDIRGFCGLKKGRGGPWNASPRLFLPPLHVGRVAVRSLQTRSHTRGRRVRRRRPDRSASVHRGRSFRGRRPAMSHHAAHASMQVLSAPEGSRIALASSGRCRARQAGWAKRRGDSRVVGWVTRIVASRVELFRGPEPRSRAVAWSKRSRDPRTAHSLRLDLPDGASTCGTAGASGGSARASGRLSVRAGVWTRQKHREQPFRATVHSNRSERRLVGGGAPRGFMPRGGEGWRQPRE